MRFNFFLIFFVFSCTINTTNYDNRSPYNSKGFAYIYNEKDFKNKIIKGRLDNSKLQISHSGLKPNALIKIINPKKAKIFNEEKRISSNAPVTSVEISNISKNKAKKRKIKKNEFSILIGTFYSEETTVFLKQRITKELPNYDIKKLQITKKNNNKINLISGPYNSVNIMKKDYSELRKFGFEDLDVIINE